MNLGSQRQQDSEEVQLQHQGSGPHRDRDRDRDGAGQGGESAGMVLPSSLLQSWVGGISEPPSPLFLFCPFIWSLSLSGS